MYDYIPVFRGHSAEFEVIDSYDFPNNFLPLIECVTAYDGRNKNQRSFQEYYSAKLSNLNEVILEIPQNVKQTHQLSKPKRVLFDKIKESIYEQVHHLNQLSQCRNIIPCISIEGNLIYTEYEIKTLLELVDSEKKAIRIHPGKYSNSMLENLEKISMYISKYANPNDLIILNANSNTIGTTRCNKLINAFSSYIEQDMFNTYLFHHTIKQFSIRELIDDKFSSSQRLKSKVNFDTVSSYKNYGFNGFADFVGLLPYSIHTTTKLTPFPSYIPVCSNFKGYWGFKGIKGNLDSYHSHVYKKYIASDHFSNLNKHHIDNCQGCSRIIEMESLSISTKSSDWRKITMLHYLAVVSEHFGK